MDQWHICTIACITTISKLFPFRSSDLILDGGQSIVKRAKSEEQVKFYNYTPPVVSAYVASQGVPDRVISLVSSAASSSPVIRTSTGPVFALSGRTLEPMVTSLPVAPVPVYSFPAGTRLVMRGNTVEHKPGMSKPAAVMSAVAVVTQTKNVIPLAPAIKPVVTTTTEQGQAKDKPIILGISPQKLQAKPPIASSGKAEVTSTTTTTSFTQAPIPAGSTTGSEQKPDDTKVAGKSKKKRKKEKRNRSPSQGKLEHKASDEQNKPQGLSENTTAVDNKSEDPPDTMCLVSQGRATFPYQQQLVLANRSQKIHPSDATPDPGPSHPEIQPCTEAACDKSMQEATTSVPRAVTFTPLQQLQSLVESTKTLRSPAESKPNENKRRKLHSSNKSKPLASRTESPMPVSTSSSGSATAFTPVVSSATSFRSNKDAIADENSKGKPVKAVKRVPSLRVKMFPQMKCIASMDGKKLALIKKHWAVPAGSSKSSEGKNYMPDSLVACQSSSYATASSSDSGDISTEECLDTAAEPGQTDDDDSDTDIAIAGHREDPNENCDTQAGSPGTASTSDKCLEYSHGSEQSSQTSEERMLFMSQFDGTSDHIHSEED